MKKSKLILLIVALALGPAGAFAQTVNPNVPARVDWEAYAPNPADKTFPLLPSDIGKTITVEARTAALPGARLLSPQPVIVSRNDTLLSLRYPPTNAIINGWIEVKIDGIVRFAGSLSLHKNPRPAKGSTQLSYVTIPGPAGAPGTPASTTAITALQTSVTNLQTGKVDNATYSAFLGAQATIDANQNSNTTNALTVAQGAATGVASVSASVVTNANAITALSGTVTTQGASITANAAAIALKADAATTYTKTQVETLLTGYYKPTPVSTKAAAIAIAVGLQPRIITVAVDESDSGNTGNVYLYHGNNQPLGLPLF